MGFCYGRVKNRDEGIDVRIFWEVKLVGFGDRLDMERKERGGVKYSYSFSVFLLYYIILIIVWSVFILRLRYLNI